MREYHRCIDGNAITREKMLPEISGGTFNYYVQRYYKSPEFIGLSHNSKRNYTSSLNRFCDRYGAMSIEDMTRAHIKEIMAGMADTPSAANALLQRLRTIMMMAIDDGLRADDPTHGIKKYTIKNDGFHTWTEEEIAVFENHYAIGTPERLAFSLMLYTGQRRSDAVTMGWTSIKDGRIAVTQQKTKTYLEIPIHPDLMTVLSRCPHDSGPFMRNADGGPYNVDVFGQWFNRRCVAAGIPHCTAHGLRKAAARRLAEAGCSNQLIKAITGHKTDHEITRYTAAASQVMMAEQAMAAAYSSQKTKRPIV